MGGVDQSQLMRKSHACRVSQKVAVVLLIVGMGQVQNGRLYVKEIRSGFFSTALCK